MQDTTHYDVIVIGSGIGGLTAAGLLARVAGKKVLVLERHLEPGGLTHTFRRDGASWDVGLHYVGQMEPGSLLRQLFDFLSDGELHWNRLPAHHERCIHPGVDFRVPSDPVAYRQRLVDTWPDEARAIKRYFHDVKRAVRWANLGFASQMVPKPVAPLLRLLRKWHASLATQTTSDYMERHFRSPHLRALLASPWGDYGLPPSRSAFAMHAIIVTHYLAGAWYPAGGSGRIARTIEPGIEARSGAVRVGQTVTDILIENGRAVGVKVKDTRSPHDTIREYRAPVIISDVGAVSTYSRLLPQDDADIAHRTSHMREAISKLGQGLSAVALFLRLKESPRTLGIEGENLWINTTLHTDDMVGHTRDTLKGNPRHVFLSFGGMNAGEDHFHTAQIISFIDPAAFAWWQNQPQEQDGLHAHGPHDVHAEVPAHPDGRRKARQHDTNYLSLKRTISTGLLRCVENVIPGFSAQVMYAELATPLTFEDYSAHPQGMFYGLPATPERFAATWTGAQTPIPGLYLCGQDACIMGIGGTMMGGVAAACQVLGPRGYPLIKAALGQTGKPSTPRATGARHGVASSCATSRSRRTETPRVHSPHHPSRRGTVFTHCADRVSDTFLPPDRPSESNRMAATPRAPFPLDSDQKADESSGSPFSRQRDATLSPDEHPVPRSGQASSVVKNTLLPPGKHRATLLDKKQLAASIWKLEFLLDHPVDDFSPGQFARICVAPATWRDYSIASLDGPHLQCLISTRTGGLGSQFVEQARRGTRTPIELPLGRYTLQSPNRPTVFIATGTGIAPFLPMFRALQHAGRLQDSTLLFGCRTHTDDLSLLLEQQSSAAAPWSMPGTVVACYSREAVVRNALENRLHPANGQQTLSGLSLLLTDDGQQAAGWQQVSENPPGEASGRMIFHGRVTDALKSLPIAPACTDFYLCGSAAMVADCQTLLAQRGATRVFVERW